MKHLLIRLILILGLFIQPALCWGVPVNKIAIDPGHGGYDPGAVVQGVQEKDINLLLAQELTKTLRSKHIKVLLVRTGDYNLAPKSLKDLTAIRYDLMKRVQLSEKFGATALISIHTNDYPISCSGPEVYYYKKSPASNLLARSIQKNLHQIPGVAKRTNKAANFYIFTHAKIPCVLVETGFINNPVEREKLLDQKYRQTLANAIAKGIMEYLKDCP